MDEGDEAEDVERILLAHRPTDPLCVGVGFRNVPNRPTRRFTNPLLALLRLG